MFGHTKLDNFILLAIFYRKALYFNRRFSAWIYSVLRFTLSNYNLDNYKDLKLISNDFAKRQYECDLAEAHLVLFMHDKEFLEIKRDLAISVIKLQGIVEKSILQVYGLFSECDFDIQLAKDDLGKQLEIRSNIHKKHYPVLEANKNDVADEYKKVHVINTSMTELINRRLKLLEE